MDWSSPLFALVPKEGNPDKLLHLETGPMPHFSALKRSPAVSYRIGWITDTKPSDKPRITPYALLTSHILLPKTETCDFESSSDLVGGFREFP
jgi:hypothetical protein